MLRAPDFEFRFVPQSYSLFASCPKYLEELLAAELEQLGVDDIKAAIGGVHFSASQAQAYRVCLWSRLANRVLLKLATVRAASREEVYAAAAAVNWREILVSGKGGRSGSIAVDFNGTSAAIRNSHFGAQLVKDALVDQYAAKDRPSVDRQAPDLRINAHLAKGRLTLAIDLSGESLHRRAYRGVMGDAPLKENLAAAMLMRAGWPALLSKEAALEAKQGDKAAQDNDLACSAAVLLDPMCGSGTFLLEAGLMASDGAPGLLRKRWGFEGWQQHDEAAWQSILTDAQRRQRQGLQRCQQAGVRLIGFDRDEKVLGAARRSMQRLGLGEVCELRSQSVRELDGLPDAEAGPGLLITNPPYGERMGDARELQDLYATLGGRFKQYFPGWKAAVYSSDSDLLDCLKLRASRKYRLRNGPLEGQLRIFSIAAGHGAEQADHKARKLQASETVQQVAPERPPQRAKISEELANRLRKNRQRLSKALKALDSDCYRLYDADIPEFASAVDIYADSAVVTEYAAPDSIDPAKARQRMDSTVATVQAVLELPTGQLHVKRKQRQRGKSQYSKQGKTGAMLEVHEGQARLLVNLHDYHDTGLFLDHRPVRRMIAQKARGKRFLNLFCYTGSATVHAVLGGAQSSLSVDMSAPYLAWAEQNLRLNRTNMAWHRLHKADVLAWIADCQEKFDLILLDPPSFSNSRRMSQVLDLQRDHAGLIQQCMALLADDGELIFSTNRRRFRLDDGLGECYALTDCTHQTLDPDFKRPSPAHRCWIIRHPNADVINL